MTPLLEIAVAKPGEAAPFWAAHDRAWRTEVWAFKVVWHEQSHDITALLARCEEIANYYNCHKVSAGVMNGSPALAFFERCGYHVEAILPQHTFKLDVAMVRKFLL
jgi:GNAT superfamily N-acetyltransferase